MALKQIDHNTDDYKLMVALRDEILRRPLGLSFTQEELDREKDDVLLAAFEDDIMLGCCLLTQANMDTVRLRQMAVRNNLQGKGIGQAIINFAELVAKAKGYKKICMHARDTAIGFYERCGYSIVGDQFIEVSVPHHEMQKFLY